MEKPDGAPAVPPAPQGPQGSRAFNVSLADPRPSTAIRLFEFECIGAGRECSSSFPPPDVDEEEEQKRAAEAMARRLAEVEQDAFQRGVIAARQEFEPLQERLEGAVASLREALRQTESAQVRDAVQLGLMIAEKVIGVTVHESHEFLAAIITTAIEAAEGSEPLTIVSSPATAARLRALWGGDEVTARFGQVNFAEDPHLKDSDFMLYRGSGTLDARLKTRLERIERALIRELGLEVHGGDGRAS